MPQGQRMRQVSTGETNVPSTENVIFCDDLLTRAVWQEAAHIVQKQ